MASSTRSSGYAPSGANDGDRTGRNWANGGGWSDATYNAFPDWLQITFKSWYDIGQVDVFTIQDNYASGAQPTQSMTFTQNGVTDFRVQYWNGRGWFDVPGGNISGNNRVWRRLTFTPINTNAVRVLVTSARNGHSRIVELEAWTGAGGDSTPPAPPPPSNVPPIVYLTSPESDGTFTAPAMVSLAATAADSDGRVSRVEFYRNATLLGTATTPAVNAGSAGVYVLNNSGVPAGAHTYTARAYDDRGAVAISAARTVHVQTPPPPPPPPAMPTIGTRIPLTDGPHAPTWHVANPQLSPQYRGDRPFGNYRDILGWRVKGGDWLDINNVPNGPTPHATAQITSSSQSSLSFSVRNVVQKLLASENSGMLVRTTHWVPAAFASRENGSTPGPRLQVVTNMGTFSPPCIADTYVTSSGGNHGSLHKIHAPAMLKFDLSVIPAGAVVQSATLTLRPIAIYSGLPQTYMVDYLDMPPLITDPARQLGNVQGGIAATVAKDGDLANHPDIMFYTQLESPTEIKQNWGGDNGRDFLEHEYISWPEFSMKAMRHVIRSRSPVGAAMHKWTQPEANTSARSGTRWRQQHTRPYVYNQALGYDELYFRFMIKIDPNVYIGANDAIKLPGMAGIYEWSTSGAQTLPEPWGGKWYAMLQHGRPAESLPHHYRLWVYYYGADNVWNTGTPPGMRGAQRYTDVVLRAGQTYSIEQRIKLNTTSDGGLTWNRDGIMEIWVDGVKVYSDRESYFREHISAQIQDAPWFQMFHGGTGSTSAAINHEISGIAVSRRYIGPARRVGQPGS